LENDFPLNRNLNNNKNTPLLFFLVFKLYFIVVLLISFVTFVSYLKLGSNETIDKAGRRNNDHSLGARSHVCERHYQTVARFFCALQYHFNHLRGLEEKGFIDHEQFGNTYRYFAKISKDEYGKNAMKDFVAKYFNRSYSSVVSMFVEEQEISTEEIRELIRQVEKGDSKTE